MNLAIRKLALRALPVLLLGVLCCLALAADDAAPVSFTGTWKTIAGGSTPYTVILKQAGNKVTGSYSPGNGKIFEGVVVGRKVTFKWTQDGGYEGTGEFTLDEDGKGFIGSSSAQKPRQFTNKWSTPHKPPSNFAGDWDTTATSGKYIVTLSQTGNQVSGTYTPNNGKITGTINGKILRFSWTQDGGKGSGRFVMNDDNQSWSGGSNNGDDPDEVDSIWNGVRYQPPSFAGVWDSASGGDYKYGMLLQQDGKQVTGIFAPGNGKITDGVIDGKILRFKWTQDGGQNGQLSGSGRFELNADGKSFRGTSNQTDDPDANGNSWNGSRPKPAFAGTWDMRAGAGTPYVLTVTQLGSKVTGKFTHGSGNTTLGNGTLSGTLAGNLLALTWTQDGGYKGTGKMELSDDGQSFTGVMTPTEGPSKDEVQNSGTRRPSDFSGEWKLVSAGAYYYDLTLQQTGDTMTGSYKANDSKIKKDGNGQITGGKVLGNTVYFSWTQEGGYKGFGAFTLDARGRTFSGWFRNGNEQETVATATRK